MRKLLLLTLACVLLPASARAAIAIDKTVSKDQGSPANTVATAAFSTASANELLLAFISTDATSSGTNIVVNSVTTAGLTWTLVGRTNAQRGTAEVWRSFAPAVLTNITVSASLSQSAASSLTVVAFSGVDTTGTNGSGAIGAVASGNKSSGAPTGSLVTTRNNSWVFGVGNDWDKAVARNPAAGQTIVHSYLAPVGDTYWVQELNAPTPSSGTTVNLNDTAPTADQYNLTICEVLPAAASSSFTLSGTISPQPAGSGVSVSVTGPSVNTNTTTSGTGAYSVAGLANGTYTVTPTKTGASFTPTNRVVTVNGANASGNDFTVQTYSISGTVSGGAGATVTLSGAASGSVAADGSGNYAFAGLLNGSYTVTPTKVGSTFSPSSQPVTVSGANVTGVNFAAVYSISGTITGGAGATVTLSGAASAVTTADGNGNFSFTGLLAGNYTVTPSLANTQFNPPNSGVQITNANVTGVNFAVVKYTISGVISGPVGATVTLSGAASAVTTSDSAGNYSFTGLLNGSYTVTPSKTGFVFTPSNQSVPINGASASAINFSAPTYSISGNISGGAGANVALSGATSANATADGSGNYSFGGLPNGGYTVTPTKTGSTFSPSGQPVTISDASVTGINFAALYSISGTITRGGGATVTLSGDAATATTADSSGNYSLTGLVAGNYTVTPTLANTNFNPASVAVSLTNAGATGVNFAAVTYTISGVISGPVGATVTLSGAASAVTTSDASGNYTFTALLNGDYTITPSKTGFAFNPPNQALTLSGVNLTAINFTAPTYAISGTVTGGAAATVTLTGASSATVTADASGNYSFPGLGNGSYAVTPTKSGSSFTPASLPATINSANVQGINFTTAALPTLAIDATAFGDARSSATSVTTTAFSTTSPNEVLLAFVGADVSTASGTNNSVSSITTAGLTWVLVRRNNTERGTAEIWSAFAATTLSNVTAKANLAISAVSSITVMSFKGANTSGTNGSGAIGATSSGSGTTGAPTASLKTTGNNSLVVAIGEDWNAAPTITPGANQTIVHLLSLAGLNTFWVQKQNALTAAAGTTVTINDTAPTSDMYNLTICEVLGATTGSGPSTYSISGTISPTAGGAGATVALSGAATASTVTGSDGSYSFSGLANGTYTLTPSNVGYTFSPTSQTVTVNNANTTGANFTASVQGATYSISGTISPTAGGAGATVALSGAATASTVTGSDGSYSFPGLANGTYTLTPSNAGYVFSPTSRTLTVNSANITGANFTASVQGPTYSISGTISPTTGGVGATVALSGAATRSTLAGSDGSYSFSGLANGTYTLTPSNGGYTFSPTGQTVTVNNANITGANFTASAQGIDTISGTVTSSGSGAQVTLRNTVIANAPTLATATADIQGNYSFPGLPAGTYSVTPGKSGYAFGPTTKQVTITSGNVSSVNFTAAVVPITISPAAATLLTSKTQQFTATVTGPANTSVTWSASGGSISSGGLFTANSAGIYTVTATSVADNTKTASASVDVILPSATSMLFGDQTVESQADATLPLGQAEAFLVSANKSGSLQSLAVYLDPASTVTSLTAGLYADSNGHPGSLLVQGTITQLVAGAWNPIIVPATPVVGGTSYWVALLGSNSGTLVFREGTSGGCSGEVSSQTNLTSLAPTWTTEAASSNCPLSVFGDSAKVVFYDTFAGTTISPMWTLISRHGEYPQNETECNIPQQVSVSNGLTITAVAQSWSCGDFIPPNGTQRNAPAPWSYITGDVQWSNLNFTYGTVEIRAKFPSSTTSLWPATWLLGSNCQLANIFTGDTGIGACPDLGASTYTEIDMTECIGTNWCQLNIANPSFNIGGGCNNITYHIDANYHTFTTVWNSSGIVQYYDASSVSTCNSNLNKPMFLIMQIQTGGVAGTPNNSALPASLLIEHVKVTQP